MLYLVVIFKWNVITRVKQVILDKNKSTIADAILFGEAVYQTAKLNQQKISFTFAMSIKSEILFALVNTHKLTRLCNYTRYHIIPYAKLCAQQKCTCNLVDESNEALCCD